MHNPAALPSSHAFAPQHHVGQVQCTCVHSLCGAKHIKHDAASPNMCGWQTQPTIAAKYITHAQALTHPTQPCHKTTCACNIHPQGTCTLCAHSKPSPALILLYTHKRTQQPTYAESSLSCFMLKVRVKGRSQTHNTRAMQSTSCRPLLQRAQHITARTTRTQLKMSTPFAALEQLPAHTCKQDPVAPRQAHSSVQQHTAALEGSIPTLHAVFPSTAAYITGRTHRPWQRPPTPNQPANQCCCSAAAVMAATPTGYEHPQCCQQRQHSSTHSSTAAAPLELPAAPAQQQQLPQYCYQQQ